MYIGGTFMNFRSSFKNGQVSGSHLTVKIGFPVLVAHLPNLIEAAELQRLVLVDGWTNIFAIVAIFHFLQKNAR